MQINRIGTSPKKVYGRDNPNYEPGAGVHRASGHGQLIDNRNVQDLKDSFNSYVENEGNGFDTYDEEEEVISEMKDRAPDEIPDFNVVKEHTDSETVMKSYANETIRSAKYRFLNKNQTNDSVENIEQHDLKIHPEDEVIGSDGGRVEFDSSSKERNGDPVAHGYHFGSDEYGQPKYITSDGKLDINS